MKFMLDTNICIYAIKKKPEKVFKKLRESLSQGVCISAITLGELEYGVCASAYPLKNKTALFQFLSVLYIMPFDEKAAAEYGVIRADLQKKGSLIGNMDMLIAANCLAENLVLVTNNTKEFERVKGLDMENWAQ